MTLNFFSVITIISIFLTCILAIFFLVTPKGAPIKNRILGVLLILFGFQVVYSFLVSTYTYNHFLGWHKPVYLLRQSALLIGPVLFLYTQASLKRSFKLHSIQLLHAIPLLIMIITLLVFYQAKGDFSIWATRLDFYNSVLILVQNIVYLIAIIVQLRRAHLTFRALVHDVRKVSVHAWLQILLIGFILIWMVHLYAMLIVYSVHKYEWCAYLESIKALIAFLFINSIMFLLLLKPELYYVVEKYRNSTITEDEKDKLLKNFQAIMKKEKFYLDPDITLSQVAGKIGVNARILSQLINERYQKNFRGFILEQRINESKQLLSDVSYHDLTILEILYKVGFNTKSAFNKQFKLHTQLTPQEYRAQFLN